MNDELEKFVNACIAKGDAEESGDFISSKDKKNYNTINSVYHSLKEGNRLNELLALLDHEHPYVRMWASGYTLHLPNSKAEKVLTSLSKLRGNIGFCAENTLIAWKKGALKF